MREMHKWKDKVEFSLDNRQIFFLFFGLSVVGCFVFALGVMVGRQVTWDPQGEVAALSGDSLAMLETPADESDLAGGFSFREGLREPANVGTADGGEQSAGKETAAAEGAASASGTPGNSSGGTNKDGAQAAEKDAPKVMASTTKGKVKGKKSRRFTLQMKAFSRRAEADKFAERLRGNGHDVRVEENEVRGRIWHRVRLGSYGGWDEALAAKADFERAEHLIAYVVRE
jgi:cell division septation protein DedD